LKTFVAKHAEKITGVLSGFDRMLFRGTLRELSYAAGMTQFLSIARVIRLLRAHRLLRKIPRTHRYKTTPRAHEIVSLLLATRELTSEQINHLAA
jgi:DNA-binding IclR family transcriptional regulator